MAKTPDPTRLADEDAEEFRDVVRQARDLKGLTNQAIADHLEWDVRKLTSALTTGRTILSKTAFELLKGVSEIESDAASDASVRAERLLKSLLNRRWMLRERFANRVPAVLIPTNERRRLALMLADAIAGIRGIGISEKKHGLIVNAIESRLRARAPKMARAWVDQTSWQIMHEMREAVPSDSSMPDIVGRTIDIAGRFSSAEGVTK